MTWHTDKRITNAPKINIAHFHRVLKNFILRDLKSFRIEFKAFPIFYTIPKGLQVLILYCKCLQFFQNSNSFKRPFMETSKVFVHTQPSGERKQPINVYILGVFTEKLFSKPADDIHKYFFHCF